MRRRRRQTCLAAYQRAVANACCRALSASAPGIDAAAVAADARTPDAAVTPPIFFR